MEIRRSDFGKLKTGEQVWKYHLENDYIKVNLLNYGGIITEIKLKDRLGIEENIVLGFDNIQDYEEKSPFFGALTGRVAGRIAGARFEIDGIEYKLPKNNGENSIHGGLKGLDKRIWKSEEVEKGIELSYFSKDGEEGYPANVEFRVRYKIEKEELKIEYIGIPDRKTYINLTNHSYFNLSGGKEDILNHNLYIEADKFLELNKNSIPTGIEKNVDGTPFDRRQGDTLKEIIQEDNEDLMMVGGGIDHPYLLKKGDGNKIKLFHQSSGRSLEVETSEPSVVVYTGNSLGDEGMLNLGIESKKYMGVCLETQDFPNMVNSREKVEYSTPDKVYRTFTKYKFSTN